MATVTFDNVVKAYDNGVTVLHDINLDVKNGEFVVFVGPSGCGKSTLMRMLAGLENVTQGAITIDGKRVDGLAPREREIAMVFQDYALYPHKTVFENMAFGLRLRKMPKAEIEARVKEAAEILKLGHLLDRKPRNLSGGQRQRVAMGRAIVRHAKVFLFDEPLSNLDAKLRNEMRVEIKKLHQRLGATMIYVTHDQVEAMTLADRIAVLSGGHVVQYGTPDEIYNSPRTTFVAGFTGSPPMNLLKLDLDGARGHGRGIEIAVPPDVLQRHVSNGARQITFGVRPESVIHVPDASAVPPGRCPIDARVIVTEPLGSETLCTFDVAGQPLVARLGADVRLEPGSTAALAFDPAKAHWFDAESGVSLSRRSVN
ncbi:ABC transporter ATP-binding protein [Burkholderia multivorans]|uniref:ABC transporter ATP-binding protein n=1 Tax=Burkholderia multivorans TaxID=87883 RepID=UPI0019D0062A|nr:sn-glycerol-3-phosphate ABC transporter ATP-binding protein UgpC [Burkholderia multivorans]MBN6738829.1 sn-glycerol-3-phosphate ABC transporter ATP-binding protein UgpC [Burkholderia multivorans]MBN7130102.1 sn-glycerol-3-phosphate ABC transporter ATP-binding protein UgpC [Burkholderia multivorans]MBN8173459.1 sn-glycerol-3-phosphate ABC transporter ATP-binding protein UgpC [Burkholderia multivorans]QSL29417.1 sn-glycerol-3-phosphate ABC transporter ATP-binding protein UgpC [Burkholderia mul